jgi:hypothetical protein
VKVYATTTSLVSQHFIICKKDLTVAEEAMWFKPSPQLTGTPYWEGDELFRHNSKENLVLPQTTKFWPPITSSVHCQPATHKPCHDLSVPDHNGWQEVLGILGVLLPLIEKKGSAAMISV